MAIRFDELEWRNIGAFNSELGTGSGTSNHFWLRIDGEGWCKAFVAKHAFDAEHVSDAEHISDAEAYSIMYWGRGIIRTRSKGLSWLFLREKSPQDGYVGDIRRFDMFKLALLLSTAEWEPPQE